MFQAELIELERIKGLVVNFLPSWWVTTYGITWGERMFYDPEYRIESDRTMRHLLAERFPGLGIGTTNPTRRPVQPTLNNALTPAAFGCEVFLPDDGYARWRPADSYGWVLSNTAADSADAFPFSELISQTRRINDLLDTDEKPFLPPMGVLNNAIQLLGDEVLGDLLDDPPRAQAVLAKMADHEIAKVRFDVDHGWRGFWFLFNCSVDMIGPDIYRATVLEHDARVAQTVRSLGSGVHLHHCGRFDRFASAYRELGLIGSLEVGFPSAPEVAADFPTSDGPLYVILDQAVVRTGTPRRVCDHVEELVARAGAARRRLTLLALDLEYGTPDENVVALIEACRRDIDA